MKYKLTEETQILNGHVLHRIECVDPFEEFKSGDKGGWIESEENLSQDNTAWVNEEAIVYGNAKVIDDAGVFAYACIYGNAEISGNARVSGKARVSGNAKIYDNAWIFGDVIVCDDAKIHNNVWVSGEAYITNDADIGSISDFIVFKNNWSSGEYFTWTKSNDMWQVGWFYGSGEELIEVAYEEDENVGKHYEAYVKFVEQLKTI